MTKHEENERIQTILVQLPAGIESDELLAMAMFYSIAHAMTDFIRNTEGIKQLYFEYLGNEISDHDILLEMAHDFFQDMADGTSAAYVDTESRQQRAEHYGNRP